MNVDEAGEAREALRTLAARRGWTPVLTFIAALAAPSALLLAPEGVASEPLARWLAGVGQPRTARTLALEPLARDPAPALAAERVIAAFACGRLIELEAMEAVARTLFRRPAGSYAIAYTGAERIGSEEDLDHIERGIWRLLVPDAPGDWAGQDLAARGIYLLGDGGASFLQGRLGRDRAALAAWWAGQLAPECIGELARRQTLWALDLAEECVAREDQGAAFGGPYPTEDALITLHAALMDLRHRLARRITEDMMSVERQVTVSLQGLELDLLAGLAAHLKRLPAGAGADGPGPVITSYIAAGSRAWQQRVEDLLRSSAARIAADVETLLMGIEWRLVNEITEASGEHASYPDALAERLVAGPLLSSVALPSAPDRGHTAGLAPMLGGAITGSLVLAAMGLLLGGASGLIVAGAVGATGGGYLSRRRGHGKAQALLDEQARAGIQAVIGETIMQVRRDARQTAFALCTRATAELVAIEEALDRAMDARGSAGEVRPPDADRALLLRLRTQLQAPVRGAVTGATAGGVAAIAHGFTRSPSPVGNGARLYHPSAGGSSEKEETRS